MDGGRLDYEAERATSARRRWMILGALALAVVAGGAALVILTRGPTAEDALADFLIAYQERDYTAAAALTDGKPDEVAAALEANVDGLDGAELTEAEIGTVSEEGGEARASASYAWEVSGIGAFAYENPTIRLKRSGEEWLVAWRDSVVHPSLDEGERLGTTRAFGDRAPILDRDGTPLVTQRPVVEIGIVAGSLPAAKVETAVEAIASATEADARTLRRALAAAESPDNFVPAITLRKEEFDEVDEELGPVPGIEFGGRELALAPTKEFARALLGTVGPITAEQLEELGEPYAAGDNVGQSGLQLAFEDRLAGTPNRAVVVRDTAEAVVEELHVVEGKPGKPLRTTLDLEVQTAAEAALGESEDVSALVAVEPGSGDVLASATRPVEDGFNRAFEGQYPPGSTFKVVTTAALLEAGLDPDETVNCPPTIVAGGREFRNFEGAAAGAVPFRTDFAESCNTAFISLADRLEPEDLTNAALDFGLGPTETLLEDRPAVPTFLGQVPPARDEVERAASMIGQGRILVSPLAMAGVAATVIAGRRQQPRVLADDPRASGARLPADHLATLRSLMRDVITKGTGAALSGVQGEPIGKSGTAEYGSGDPPPTHAWFIAAREDVAVAVLVEDKPSGGEFAAPIAARFLEALPSP